jgi:hypothetical protein
MKVNITLAAVLGAAAASVFALPAQAATVKATAIGGSTSTSYAAYRVEGVTYNEVTYNVDFDHGTFDVLYGAGAPRFDPAFANGIGNAILTALAAPTSLFVDTMSKPLAPITQLIDGLSNTPAGFGTDVKSQFYIPIIKSPSIGNGVDNTAFCVTSNPVSATNCGTTPQDVGGAVMYAKWEVVPNDTVPTPALLPGLLGLGLAALRKKQQAEAVAA